FYNDKKYIDQAIANLKQGIILSPERLQLYYVLGESYIISDQPDLAIETLEQALNLNPIFADTYYYLGRAYLSAGQLNQAYDYIITQAISDRKYIPPNSTILLAMAQEYGDKNDYEKVISIYKIILELEPKVARNYAILAAAYLQANQTDLAIQAATKAAELDPSYRAETDLFIQMIKSGRVEELKEATK
ncbi:MAG: tetratricopeptide repeat protein, partial [Patescibacteria group bacterium]|nr:tetratricopeptide repeat protein [Patescibacteria group bacterium]